MTTMHRPRLSRIEADQATTVQREVMAELLAARGKPGGRLANLYAMMVRQPEMARLMGATGAYVRFHSSLPELCREAAILALCQAVGFDYEIAAHREIIVHRGLSPDQLVALDEQRHDRLPRDLAAAAGFAVSASAGRAMPQGPWDEAVDVFGPEGALDLLLTCAHYTALAVVANVLLPEIDPPGHSLGKPA
mgnify:CR=1 FL=1